MKRIRLFPRNSSISAFMICIILSASSFDEKRDTTKQELSEVLKISPLNWPASILRGSKTFSTKAMSILNCISDVEVTSAIRTYIWSTHTFIETTTMHRLQRVSTSIVMINGARWEGSTPYPGTIQDLTFNLFSILADQHLSANALLWITVWITALGRVSGTASRGSSFAARASGTPKQGYWGWLLDLDRVGSRGGACFSRCLRFGPRAGNGLLEAVESDFVWVWCKTKIRCDFW